MCFASGCCRNGTFDGPVASEMLKCASSASRRAGSRPCPYRIATRESGAAGVKLLRLREPCRGPVWLSRRRLRSVRRFAKMNEVRVPFGEVTPDQRNEQRKDELHQSSPPRALAFRVRRPHRQGRVASAERAGQSLHARRIPASGGPGNRRLRPVPAPRRQIGPAPGDVRSREPPTPTTTCARHGRGVCGPASSGARRPKPSDTMEPQCGRIMRAGMADWKPEVRRAAEAARVNT